MTTAHRIHHDLYRGAKSYTDPGDGGTITVAQDLQICEMVSTGAETRTLANPTKPGIRFVLRMLTDGGDIVVGASNGLNTDLDLHATFADAGDLLELISVTKSTGVYRWEVLTQTGAGIATVTATVTRTATATDTGTLTKTATNTLTKTATDTLTATDTATGTAGSSVTLTKTGTLTKTATNTLTKTATDTTSASKTKTVTATPTSTATATA